MACDLLTVAMGLDAKCEEQFAGMPDYIYIGIPVASKVAYQHEIQVENTEETNYFTDASFDELSVIGVGIKTESGEHTYKSNGANAGFETVISGLVEDDLDRMAVLERTLNNRHDWAAFFPDGNGNMFVCYAPGYKNKFEVSGTSGKERDSEKGDTITITASPMKYGRCKWHGHVKETTDGSKVTYQLVSGGPTSGGDSSITG